MLEMTLAVTFYRLKMTLTVTFYRLKMTLTVTFYRIYSNKAECDTDSEMFIG